MFAARGDQPWVLTTLVLTWSCRKPRRSKQWHGITHSLPMSMAGPYGGTGCNGGLLCPEGKERTLSEWWSGDLRGIQCARNRLFYKCGGIKLRLALEWEELAKCLMEFTLFRIHVIVWNGRDTLIFSEKTGQNQKGQGVFCWMTLFSMCVISLFIQCFFSAV